MSGKVDITGYAIVSDDDKIAGADGLTPASLRNEKDWELYQRAQELADLVVFARRSHELEPNVRGDPRLVVSRDAAGLEKHRVSTRVKGQPYRVAVEANFFTIASRSLRSLSLRLVE